MFIGASLVAQMIKNLPLRQLDPGLIPGSGRSPGEGNGSPLQYSYMGNQMDRRAWQATVHGITLVGGHIYIYVCVCIYIFVCVYT